ncbi:MAG: DEAD/DEAH box helicase [Planctomycetia bacterium]|nr:DEAD/DEAH box helicase [Planctomycetia bacterium]
MNVSRETSLSYLLSGMATNLNIDENVSNLNTIVSGLTHSAASLLLLSINHVYSKPFLVVLENSLLAEKLYLTCYNLVPDKTAFFPESPSKNMDLPGFNLENDRYRSEAVNFFRKNKSSFVFTSSTAADELSIDKLAKEDASFVLKVNEAPDRHLLLNTLNRWGYEQTDHTETPKTFSVRGGILDIFLPYATNPTRIEFFGNTIESIRVFNPRSQRTIKNINRIEILSPPNKNISAPNKISLLNYVGKAFNVVYLYDESGLLSLRLNKNCENDINLNCKNIKLSDEDISDNNISLESVLNITTPNNIFLFADNINSKSILDKHGRENFMVIQNTLETSFYSKKMNLCCLSLSELNNQKPVHNTRWTVDSVAEIPQKEFSSLKDLDWGDYLVHQDFGIGLYRGLKTLLTHDKVNQECIKIEYADNANIYVPIDKFNRVHRMLVTGDKEPTLSTLNGPKWTRQKQMAKESAKVVVQDLMNLYTSRNKERGFKYSNNNGLMQALAASFPYEETLGQKFAIESVISDMEKEFPVDRLICGDVGFGKTEVALRAILKAIISDKKVLFLTPTTILADQHFITTRGRLEPLGVNVDLLSRFKTKKQQQEILVKMLTGNTDLVVGTHRLLSQDVNFPDLGLLIIDEEHRFGVKHKEKLRRLRSSIDVLTLTATPIPRTLQQSLLGIRDISRISTPPKTRRPIKTFVQYFNWDNIKKVVNNELLRNGQIYFLHNDISSIPFILKKLIEFFPNHVTGVAHGKMKTRDLESTVLSFFAGNIDILLCTTIIESGLDVSNANTIIINNAQNFGLSQLYQIRGRVGRSNRQAYCYLLLPHRKTIGKSAHKRLKAIEHFTSLGSGYDISLKDLEIRGAGNLFGYKQSGNIAAVGFEMYCKLLQEAVDESIGNTPAQLVPKISMPLNAMLDSSYVSLVQDRLYFYQQLSEARDIDSVNRVEAELLDRFGRLPESAKNIMHITKLRVRLTGTAVTYVSIIGSDLTIRLTDFSPFQSAQELFKAVGEKLTIYNFNYQFAPSNDSFSISIKAKDLNHSLKALELLVTLFSK